MKQENRIYLGDNLDVLPSFETDSFDCMVTDPPYGISFLNKKWDDEVPAVKIWKECLRVLKPGAFAFVMTSVRQDVLARTITNLDDAGFAIPFSPLFWTYATGFPKGSSISKIIDKRAGAAQKTIGHYQSPDGRKRDYSKSRTEKDAKIFKTNRDAHNKAGRPITAPVTEKAKEFIGAYPGFSPKPAVEMIAVVMKPLESGCNSYVDQVVRNGHGCTWLENCKMPIAEGDQKGSGSNSGITEREDSQKIDFTGNERFPPDQTTGRFPTNLLCEDDVLNEGLRGLSYSRYFSLEEWFGERIKHLPKEAMKTFPWLVVPKPSTSEKEKHLEKLEKKTKAYKGHKRGFVASAVNADGSERKAIRARNIHPTIKPLKLMNWLIVLGTQEGEIVLDPFLGSGTTLLAAKMTGRYCAGIEMSKEYYTVACQHVNPEQQNIYAYK
jgi:site-specific DNA-methyltransferase (adenine-specific)